MTGKQIVQVECGENTTFCVVLVAGEKTAKRIGDKLLSHCINYSERKTRDLFEDGDYVDDNWSSEVCNIIKYTHTVIMLSLPVFIHHFTLISKS